MFHVQRISANNLYIKFSMNLRNYNQNIVPLSLVLIALLISVTVLGAGDSLRLINDLQLDLELHYGSVIPHHKSIEYSLKRNIGGFEIALATDTYGRTSWDKLYRYPRIGTGYLFTTFGNREVFGTANAVFLFMNFPFSTLQTKFSMGYQINFGLAYLNRLYNVDENPLNMAISTGPNVYLCLRMNTRLLIDPRNELSLNVGFSHFSNGKLASPNLGINTGCFMLGYQYRITNPKYERILEDRKGLQEKHTIEVIVSGGLKTDDQVTGNYYFISSLVCDYIYHFTMKYGLGAGTDLFYDQALGPNVVAVKGGTYSSGDLFQSGLHGAFYAQYSRLTAFVDMGSYMFTNYFKYTRIYTRIGIRYQVNRRILLNLSLKAHYAIADYVEWGIGYRFVPGKN